MSDTLRGGTEEVIVVGAGVAGLAAASALSMRGFKVTILERKPFVGGRAFSYEHPVLHEVVDCQHVLLGCCTNLIDLLERNRASGEVRWYETITFLEQGGRRSEITPSGLPAPLHSSFSFVRAKMLDARDKLAIARGMAEFLRGIPENDAESVASWMKRSGQTERSIRHFWEPVLVVTLNDSFENCSLHYAAKVFRELFLKTVEGSRLGIPKIPLSELFGKIAQAICVRGGTLEDRASIDGIEQTGDGRWQVRAGNREWSADAIVLAVSVDQMQKLTPVLPVHGALSAKLDHFTTSPYITTHLWFEEAFTELHHAALLDSTYQWLFHKSMIRNWVAEKGSYVEVVIGGSRTFLPAGREELVKLALDELASFFPDSRKAKLVKSVVLKEARATFSVTPGLDAFRPSAQSEWPGIFMAGDWTATDWPSTMESAARSGYLAAEAVVAFAGKPGSVLQPELSATGLMRMFG